MLQPALGTPGREEHVRLHSSAMTWAMETCELIRDKLPKHVLRTPPDPNLNEGFPAHRIPGAANDVELAEDIYVESMRAETAFRWYLHRADLPTLTVGASAGNSEQPLPRHEYDVLVCHGNIIRYFLMRALQLPPEAWLRLCGMNCGITHVEVRPNGSISVHSFGDTGHLPLEDTTFSMKCGYEW